METQISQIETVIVTRGSTSKEFLAFHVQNKTEWTIQENYIEKVIEMFNAEGFFVSAIDNDYSKKYYFTKLNK